MDPLRDLARQIVEQNRQRAGIAKPVRKATKTIGIREAVEYLAYNDEQELGDEDHGYTVCVTMMAHLFDREPKDIAEMVMRKRDKIDY